MFIALWGRGKPTPTQSKQRQTDGERRQGGQTKRSRNDGATEERKQERNANRQEQTNHATQTKQSQDPQDSGRGEESGQNRNHEPQAKRPKAERERRRAKHGTDRRPTKPNAKADQPKRKSTTRKTPPKRYICRRQDPPRSRNRRGKAVLFSGVCQCGRVNPERSEPSKKLAFCRVDTIKLGIMGGLWQIYLPPAVTLGECAAVVLHSSRLRWRVHPCRWRANATPLQACCTGTQRD